MNQLRLAFLTLIAGTLIFSSCNNDDDDVFANPTAEASSGVVDVVAGEEGTVTFNVTHDPGLTASYTASGSNVTVSNPAGQVSGTSVDINFTAGAAAGAASVDLVVTDTEGQRANATAVINIQEDPDVIRVTTNITSDQTWETGKTYILAGRITVEDGATLTIEPGTVIKGEGGQREAATALLVARGGMLMAEGNENLPIVFTSLIDEITPDDLANGNFASPNLDPDQPGLWGGVLILGRAPISASNENGDDVIEVQIEGIPTSDPNGLYGGTDPLDNSGVLRYVSIRHGGTNIGAGNEINGLTLGGVGSGTVIEHVEVVANQDDGVEWFGGTVDVDNVVVWNAGDDAIDTDQAWSGTLDNFFVVTPSDRPFELDGPEGSLDGEHTIRNGSVFASDVANDIISGDLINLDENSQVNLENIFITGINDDPEQQINRVEAPEGTLTFANVILDVPANDLSNYVSGPVPSGITSGTTVQGDATIFGWTWANEVGGLDIFK